MRSRLKIISPLAALSRAARPDLKLFYEKGQGHFTPTGVGILVRGGGQEHRFLASPYLLCGGRAPRGGALTGGVRCFGQSRM